MTSLAAAGPTSNVRLTSNESLTANKTVNAILFAGSSTNGNNISIDLDGFALGIASGALLTMGAQTLTIGNNVNNNIQTDGTVDFGSAEGIINNNNSNLTLNSPIAGTGGVTMTSTTGGNITLNVANSYAGQTFINGNGGQQCRVQHGDQHRLWQPSNWATSKLP